MRRWLATAPAWHNDPTPMASTPKGPADLRGPAVLAALLAMAELAWRVAGQRWAWLVHGGAELVRRLHPDITASPEAADIALGYSHALWLLLAVVLACAVLGLFRATLLPGLWAPSPWVALLPVVAVVAAGVVFLVRTDDAQPTPEQRSLQAEHEQASGTGAASYERVLKLVDGCHASIRQRLASQAGLLIDDGLVPAESFVYTYELRGAPGQRIVRVAATERDVASGSLAAIARALMPPIDGGYQVEGLLSHGGTNVESRSYREYHCSMRVTGERYEVRDLRLNPIR